MIRGRGWLLTGRVGGSVSASARPEWPAGPMAGLAPWGARRLR